MSADLRKLYLNAIYGKSYAVDFVSRYPMELRIRTTKARMCDECGLPDRGHDGIELKWPHMHNYDVRTRALPFERMGGIPSIFPPEITAEHLKYHEQVVYVTWYKSNATR